MIAVKEYISTGFSIDDAEKLDNIIKPYVERKEKVDLDFTGVKNFTTLFFNTALAKHLVEMGPETYEARFLVKNLSEMGEVTYRHSKNNAVNYYKMSQKQRKEHEQRVEDIE